MPYLQKFLAGLMLFSPAIYAIATPDQAELGKVKGFTGPAHVNPNGDYLTAYFCYCEYAQKTEEIMGPAHFYQFEYYNWHHNTTFVLISACPDGDIGFDMPCVPTGGGQYVLTADTMDSLCKHWEGYETVEDNQKVGRNDEFCYLPHRKRGADYMTFNNQRRNLGPNGRQGPIVGVLEPGTCENLCRDNMDMDVLRDGNFPPSHQVEWNDLDDMCWDCK